MNAITEIAMPGGGAHTADVPIINGDFETRSAFIDLKKAGADRYARDPGTEVMCLSYCITRNGIEGPMREWLMGDPPPEDLFLALAGGGIFRGWNVYFEQAIWENICVPRMGWPAVRREQWSCTQARALVLAFPADLGRASMIITPSQRKDYNGHRLMMKMCKPLNWKETFAFGAEPEWYFSPSLLRQLADYCTLDVRAEMGIAALLPPLSPIEEIIWRETQEINTRGVCLDLDYVRAGVKAIQLATDRLNAELRALTKAPVNGVKMQVQKYTSLPTMRKWLLANGLPETPPEPEDPFAVETDDADAESPEDDDEEEDDATKASKLKLDAKAIGLYLTRCDNILSPAVKRVLQIRREAGKASVGKLAAMLARTDEDGRARGALVYHRASTGRDAGAGIQMQNMRRDGVKEYDIVKADLIEMEEDAFKRKYGSTHDMVSRMTRGAIVAAPGKKLVWADYSQVEARGAAYLSGATETLQQFRDGAPIYENMASKIFGYHVTKDMEAERFYGKQVVLGCLAADTKVLCQRGWVDIVNVHISDKLWDGIEWVSHSGLIAKGVKETLSLSGLSLTPDHLVLCGGFWKEAQLVAQDQSGRSLQSALAVGSSRLPDTFSGFAEAFKHSSSDVLAERQNTRLTALIFGSLPAPGAMHVHAPKPTPLRSDTTVTPGLWPTTPTGNDCSTGFHPPSRDATCHLALPLCTTGPGVFQSAQNGAQTAELSSPTSRPFRAGMIRAWKWIAKIMAKGMNQETSGLLPEDKTCSTGEPSARSQSASDSSKRKCQTYDVAFSGPRNRFTVWTNEGPVIVHNCGFGMGWPKFSAHCERLGNPVPDDLAERAVATWREVNWQTVQYWKQLGQAAIAAVQNPGMVTTAGMLSFHCIDNWLRMKLPSGRLLWYCNPRVEPDERFGMPSLVFDALNGVTKQWGKERTWGGKILENADQAMCRDFLMRAAHNAKAANYPIVLRVHDELISEVDDTDEFTPNGLVDIMCRPDKSAPDFPIASEGKQGYRYGK